MDLFIPVSGDLAGNDLKWESMKLEMRLYRRTGNYALAGDVSRRQARFCEMEGNERIAIAYYCTAFYADLNGFRTSGEVQDARRDPAWRSSARVDVGIVNRIFLLCSRCGVSDDELRTVFCKKAFTPAAYFCHLFTATECADILFMARDGRIQEIRDRIRAAEARFLEAFSAVI